MLFNSLTFVIFLPLVFAVHWGLRRSSPRLQNAVIIVASCIFYGWWDVRFLALLAFNSAVDFGVGVALETEERPRRRKQLILLSIAFNIGVLAFFKYFNFFIESFAALVESVGLRANLPSLHVILPVGISFYTFQTLSYTIHVYRRQMTATRDPFAFFAFVSFFPQLVAGPIERASHLLPQFYRLRVFDARFAIEGLRQMLWGMAKKVVVADNVAPHVNSIFNNYGSLDGVVLAWGAVLFSIQIYCDFSGYQTSPLERRNSSGSISPRTSGSPTSRPTLSSSGDAGTSHCPAGFATMCTSLWGAARYRGSSHSATS